MCGSSVCIMWFISHTNKSNTSFLKLVTLRRSNINYQQAEVLGRCFGSNLFCANPLKIYDTNCLPRHIKHQLSVSTILHPNVRLFPGEVRVDHLNGGWLGTSNYTPQTLIANITRKSLTAIGHSAFRVSCSSQTVPIMV